ncbi:MAG: type II toxin-antitoxin system VapC family toxin [Pyrinomonadaceae bacterium]
MKNLLDTCVVAEYKKPAPETKVISWLDTQLEESLFLSVLTIGEIEKGIVRLPASKRKTDLENFLEVLLARFDRRIISLDTTVLRRWARVAGILESKGRVLPIIDSLLAATALEHDLTIITRNVADFDDTGAKVLNIWE